MPVMLFAHTALTEEAIERLIPLLREAGISTTYHKTVFSLLRIPVLRRFDCPKKKISIIGLISQDIDTNEETVRQHLKIIYSRLHATYGIAHNQASVIGNLLLYITTGELPGPMRTL